MKWKQFMSAVLAAAMIITSVPAVSVAAAEEVAADALVASYDFDDETLENSVKEGDTATAIVTGLGNYAGTVAYADGRNGTKAVSLGDYGLKLNQQNLGETFTVSMWLQATGNIANNQSVLFLGYHSPEVWYSIAGRSTTNNLVKAWAYGNGYSWTEFDTFNIAKDWHLVTITDDGETTRTYLDGSEIITCDSNKPLVGANQDIYVGVNNWDPEFPGLVDDVKVYNKALSVAEIQQLDDEIYEKAEQVFEAAWAEVDLTSVLGRNESAEAVQFDLDLFDEAAGGTVAWTSSNPEVIAADGTVAAPKEITKVTMTADVTCGAFTGRKTIELTVLPLDKASLDELIEKAESVDLSKYTDESAELLASVTEAAKGVNKQDVVEIAKTEIYYALSELEYKAEYRDPFSILDEVAPPKAIPVEVGFEDTAFEIPESVADFISVEYYSSDESVVTFEDAVATVKAAGRATITSVVTSDYNGYKEEYSSVVIVSGNDEVAVPYVDAAVVNEAEKEDVLKDPTEGPLYIKESSIHQLLTQDLELPTSIAGKDVEIEYTLEGGDSEYVALEDNVLKITQPYGGDGNYTFVVSADVYEGEEVTTQRFPFTIAEGITKDTLAGYVYLCFGNRNGADVQQVHMFLSEDGLNWTAVNGFNPIFEVGTDYADLINEAGTHNYTIAAGADISETVSGDASVLFPFEGDDQGIRDPYILRGAREEDSNKVWILATDLNTMSSQYGGNLNNNTVGNWGTMSSRGSTNIFIYETEDFIHWERRYVDVGSEIGAGAAWAPEAIYNPEKDNYLVYWSCRVSVDGRARNRVYCNETEDFVTFGPTKLYEQEPNYADWGRQISGNDGYGNIDTSMLWVADDSGNPFGTIYRVVKDETDNHIELKRSDTVLDPNVDYDETEPTRITPYTFNGVERKSTADLSGLNDYQKAEVVWNWFKDESTGDHFEAVSQSIMEGYNETNGAFEGATMFKFNDRDEWCVMIDNYSSSRIRYEPYVTYDLGEADSIKKVTSGYGRTGGDVGCHGGMMPITAAEYNTIVDTYNSDPSVSNYHPIDHIEIDKRPYENLAAEIETVLAEIELDDAVKAVLEENLIKLEGMIAQDLVDADAIAEVKDQVDALLAEEIDIVADNKVVTLEAGETEAVACAEGDWEWYSIDEMVATADNGSITAVGNGSTFVVVRSGRNALELIKVVVGGEPIDDTIYDDVTEADWFYDAVYYTYYEKIMTGMAPRQFGPYGQLSRAQFALMLYRMEREPEFTTEKKFGDVTGEEWYGQAVLWAAENGIVTGYLDGNYGPADNITREQMAVMMHRYAGYLKADTTNAGDLSKFTDEAAVSGFAVEAMKWATDKGIITGKGTEEPKALDPQGQTARCEAAAIMQRFLAE